MNNNTNKIVEVFSFPHPVNEVAARIVAGMVVVLCAIFLVTQFLPLLLFLVYGFLARVISGPTLSLLGVLATKIIVPYIGKLGVKEKLVPGPPKRFAQSIGLLLSAVALGFHLLDVSLVVNSLISIILVFAILESCLSFCAGCYVFQHLMNLGLIPKDTCEKCNDISLND
tara:strand:+ start:25801 stop:26310 length:510 start_codon:yes stop_codon:yes gene_type:complete